MATSEKIPFVSVPFADQDQTKVADLDFLKSGVTSSMLIPTEQGGRKFSRSMLNGIGYFATLGGFLDRIGYPYGIEKDRGADFNGYPKGAILISEDDDYVREYVSQEDNNTNPLPQEATDGTYKGDEHWKPTLPPVADFFPDYSTYTSKFFKDVVGTGTVQYTIDEDGWYEFSASFSGGDWPAEATYNNILYRATCSVLLNSSTEICKLDGRFSSKLTDESLNNRVYPIVMSTVPLKKGMLVSMNYRFSTEQTSGYGVRLRVKRWGASVL
jgi:hypothetical protein